MRHGGIDWRPSVTPAAAQGRSGLVTVAAGTRKNVRATWEAMASLFRDRHSLQSTWRGWMSQK